MFKHIVLFGDVKKACKVSLLGGIHFSSNYCGEMFFNITIYGWGH